MDEARQIQPQQCKEQGLKLAPQSVDGYNLLGIIYNQQKDYVRDRRLLSVKP